MKERARGFAAGILATTLVGALGFTALAATGQVSFNASALTLNGTQVSAKGENYTLANGQSVPASITYTDEKGGGTTYLPVRRISELLGVETGWDGATGSVTIKGEAAAPPSQSPVTTTPPTTGSTETAQRVDITHIKVGDKFYQYGYNDPDIGEAQARLPVFIVGDDHELYFTPSASKAYTDTVSLIGLASNSVILPSSNPFIDGLYCCRAIDSNKFSGLSWKTETDYTSATSSSEVTTLTYNGHSFTSEQFKKAPMSGPATIDGIRFFDRNANINDFLAYMGINVSVSYEYDADDSVHIMLINKR